jgi:hypothetical protein
MINKKDCLREICPKNMLKGLKNIFQNYKNLGTDIVLE